MGYYFRVKPLCCYSGGTAETALYPMVIETLEVSGFRVNKFSDTKNPVYFIKFSSNEHPVIGFSKKFDDPFNPGSRFAAVMTCSDADVNCPYVSGAENRFVISYEDPKNFDHLPDKIQAYRAVCDQVATEMYFVFSQIK